MIVKEGDKFWFPSYTDEEKVGKLFTVRSVETIPNHGECVWWVEGSWAKVEWLNKAHKITDEFMRELWLKAKGI